MVSVTCPEGVQRGRASMGQSLLMFVTARGLEVAAQWSRSTLFEHFRNLFEHFKKVLVHFGRVAEFGHVSQPNVFGHR